MQLTIITIILLNVSNAFLTTRMGYVSARIEAQKTLTRGRHRPLHRSTHQKGGIINFEQLVTMLKDARQKTNNKRQKANALLKRFKATVATYAN